jgi:hypothetical protein
MTGRTEGQREGKKEKEKGNNDRPEGRGRKERTR